jgi:hypothetical protein
MAAGDQSRPRGSGGGTDTLSTGHTVDLPLDVEATMLGAAFSAPEARVADLLPDGLSPVSLRDGRAVVTFLSVEYHAMDIEGLAPYDEFAVMVPSTHGSPTTVPYATALRHATDGYVWTMPVTTEPAYALGVDVWGYPKVVADIEHTDRGPRRETRVEVDGDHLLTFELERPPTTGVSDDGFSYAVKEGELLRIPNEVDGDLGFWPLSSEVSVRLGDHPTAEPLRALALGDRALARLSVEGDVVFFDGQPV